MQKVEGSNPFSRFEGLQTMSFPVIQVTGVSDYPRTV
jgi:hypothetical protein